jgi:hypothetical protein
MMEISEEEYAELKKNSDRYLEIKRNCSYALLKQNGSYIFPAVDREWIELEDEEMDKDIDSSIASNHSYKVWSHICLNGERVNWLPNVNYCKYCGVKNEN